MTNKFEIVPNIRAFANKYEEMLQEQSEHARVIQIKEWFKEQGRLTALDYMLEAGGDMSGIISSGVVVGGTNMARELLAEERKSRAPDFVEKLELTSWLDYLASVASRRETGSMLIQFDEADNIGFIDHVSNEAVFIKLSNIRQSRKEIKADPEQMEEMAEVAERLGMADTQAAFDASRSPMSRAELLGPSPYGDQAMVATLLGEEPKEDMTPMTIEQLADMWDNAGKVTGSFAKEVPEMDDFGSR